MALADDINALPEVINEGDTGHRSNSVVLHKAAKNHEGRINALELDEVDWAEVTGKPTTFTPSTHSHAISDTTGLQTALDGKQASIAAGTTAQYWRGDKTWQTLDKAAVGLANVDNTTDANKPISTATQAALDGKADLVDGFVPTSQLKRIDIGETLTAASESAMLALSVNPGDVAIRTDNDTLWMLKKAPASTLANWWDLTSALSGVAGVTSWNGQTGVIVAGKADVGLGNVDNTSDVNKPVSTAQQAAIDAVEDKTEKDGICFVQTLSTRATGAGEIPEGIELPYALTITSVKYKMGTADASGTTTVELRKNGSAVSGTSGTASTSPTAVTGSWSFAAGDVLTVYTTAVGTTPGKRLTAYIKGVKA